MKDPENENSRLSSPQNEERKKEKPIDDGRTVAPMTGNWMPWNSGVKDSGRRGKEGKKDALSGNRPGEQLTKAEKRAILRGAFRAQLPVIAGMAIVALLLFGLACLWLMPK